MSEGASFKDQEELLQCLPIDGTPVGNTAVLRKLGWAPSRYQAVKEALVTQEILRLGQGRGGSIRRADRDPAFMKASAAQFLESLPGDGAGIANRLLRERLGWDEERYEYIRQLLIERGAILPSRGGGTGGAVRQSDVSNAAVDEPDSGALPERLSRAREVELYPRFATGLRNWASKQGWTQYEVEQTAHQGRRPTGGTWTRPDFVVVAYRGYDYTPGRTRDIETFEVKLADCPIEAVFETAAHSRFATRSYLAIQRAGKLPSEGDLKRIDSECRRFEVGLVLFDDPEDLDTWEVRAMPTRREPDPRQVEDFVTQQVAPATQQKLRHWLR